MNDRTGRLLVPGRAVYGPSGITTLSRSRIAEMVRDGLFPAPVRVSSNRTAWVLAEVVAWLDALPRTVQSGTVS